MTKNSENVTLPLENFYIFGHTQLAQEFCEVLIQREYRQHSLGSLEKVTEYVILEYDVIELMVLEPPFSSKRILALFARTRRSNFCEVT